MIEALRRVFEQTEQLSPELQEIVGKLFQEVLDAVKAGKRWEEPSGGPFSMPLPPEVVQKARERAKALGKTRDEMNRQDADKETITHVHHL